MLYQLSYRIVWLSEKRVQIYFLNPYSQPMTRLLFWVTETRMNIEV